MNSEAAPHVGAVTVFIEHSPPCSGASDRSCAMNKYSQGQMDEIASYHNWGGILQDDDGHLTWASTAGAVTGWRRVTEEQISEALKAR
jgi:hypothetical protein